jgi:hypothetical protein
MLHGSADTVLTGTMWAAMHDALRMLGYNDTHHMDSVFRDPSQIWPWTAAIYDMIYGKGKPYRRAEWDSLLGDCQACHTRIACHPWARNF